MSESSMQHYRDQVVAVAVRQNVRRIKFSRWGLAENPIGYQVKWHANGRDHLADVTDCYRRESPQAYMLRVRYFNGEDAGEIAASAVEVLGPRC